MKTAAIAALSSLFLSLVAAAPLNKRDVVWVTSTEVLTETILTTTTVYVDEMPSTSAPATPTAVGGEFYEKPGSSVVAPASAPSSYVAPAVQSPAPVAAVASSAPAPPPAPAPETPSSVYVPPPAPTSVYVAPSPSPEVAAPVAAAPQPAPVSSSSGGASYAGDMTFYDVGMGSCGWSSSNSEDVVAIDKRIMANGINPNLNPFCGKTITIKYGGNTHSAKVVDTCGGCEPNAIDVPEQLFKKVAPSGDGRVHNVEWWFN